ncbi:hypothetical protein [Spirosoma endbachense]|uniref:hypothetical protein n=1 Tax=Spirosoma endbachense TaxID=2666025 RepID=UPI001E59D607|nr:hypothetical protein [Spirosoma endbachense]
MATVARLNTQTGKVVYRDWTHVSDGARMISEFPAFLKAISSIGCPTIPIRLASDPLADFMG